jgi:hypothetical protein
MIRIAVLAKFALTVNALKKDRAVFLILIAVLANLALTVDVKKQKSSRAVLMIQTVFMVDIALWVYVI